MSAKTPTVYDRWLEDPQIPGSSIRLDSPAWLAWLEAATTSRFAYPIYDPVGGYISGVMTVRKERRQRGGWYWSVFRRSGRRVCKIYLGRSTVVTQVRLQAIADHFHCLTIGGTPDSPPTDSQE
jgi:LuxR family maltose regulon positive regulatory protein